MNRTRRCAWVVAITASLFAASPAFPVGLGVRAARTIFGGGDVVRTGARGRAIADEALLSRLGGSELADLDQAVEAFARRATEQDVKILKQALALPPAERQGTELLPWSDETPNLQMRIPGPPYREVAIRFGVARLRTLFTRPLAVDDIEVVPLALADDPASSAAEAARFNRWLPPRNRSSAGPFSNLAEAAGLDHAARVKLLMPYRERTVVLVGHVRPERDFFVFAGGKPHPINLRAWLEAARAARVNLIPIGCNTAEMAALGARGLINSDDALRGIVSALEARPATFGDFLGRVAGERLSLVLDPLQLDLFSRGARIVEPRTGQALGSVRLDGMHAAAVGNRMKPAFQGHGHFRRCLNAADPAAYQACSGNAWREAEAAEAQRRSRFLAEYRARRLAEIDAQFPAAGSNGRLSGGLLAALAAAALLLALLGIFLLAHARRLRVVEKDVGAVPWRGFVSEREIRATLRAGGFAAPAGYGGGVLLLSAAAGLVHKELALLFVAAGIVLLLGFIESLKAARREGSRAEIAKAAGLLLCLMAGSVPAGFATSEGNIRYDRTAAEDARKQLEDDAASSWHSAMQQSGSEPLPSLDRRDSAASSSPRNRL